MRFRYLPFVLMGLVCAAAPRPVAAQTKYTQAVTFTYTGKLQTFTAPSDVASITVYLWGAGGSGSNGGPAVGGGGAFVSGVINLPPGTSLDVLVGGGGGLFSPGFGGGGQGPYAGGGRSAIRYLGSELVDAGGGGGTGNFDGGAGGVSAGHVGGAANTGGGGGTQSAGGNGGGGGGSNGSSLSGGNGGGNGGGGGGGGGYYGGGGGGVNGSAGGGGGGSSYTGGFNTVLTTQDGNGGSPGGAGNSYYLPGVGAGGDGNGGNGEIVIVFTSAISPSPDLYVDKAVGSDTSGNGSASSPFQTVARALAVANGAQLTTIHVRAGSYSSDKPRVTKHVRFVNWGNTGQASIGKS